MPTYNETGSGGGTSSGEASLLLIYEIDIRGGAKVRSTLGAIVAASYSLANSVNAQASGTGHNGWGYNEIGSGGSQASGTATVNYIANPRIRGNAAVNAIALTTLPYDEIGSGGGIGGGTVPYSMGFDPSGGLTVSGEADIAPIEVFFNLTARWDSIRDVVFGIDFSWNVGQPPLTWYRVEGKCTNPTCETNGFNTAAIDCRQGTNFTQVIAARGLVDLCNKLKQGTLAQPVIWPLQSITKYSKPVYKTDEDGQCQILVPEDFCEIPECLDFCVDEVILFNLKLQPRVQDIFFEYVGLGTIYIGGTAEYETDGSQVSGNYIGAGRLTLGGEAEITATANYEDYEGSGELTVGGSADVVSPNYNYEGSGGLTVDGTAIVSSPNYNYEGSGGLTVDGTAAIAFYADGSGGVTMGGEADCQVTLNYSGTGSVEIGGTADVISSAFSYDGVGGLIVGGEAEVTSSYMGVVTMSLVMNMSIAKTYLSFVDDSSSENNLSIDDGNVAAQCGCTDLPLVLNFSQNICYGNLLKVFLTKNNLSVVDDLDASYKTSVNSWVKSIHLRGYGDLDNAMENWSMLFEWICTTAADSTEEGHWELKFLIKRQTNDGITLTTRGLFAVPPSSFCKATDNSIKLIYNTKTGSASVSSGFVDMVYFEDQIGLFRTKYWSNNPNLVFAISEERAATPIPRYDIGQFFPKTIFGN